MASNGVETGGAPPRPSGPPPPPPPGIGTDLHHDIARDIGQQVEIMILDAKHNSETKVGKEIQKIKVKMEAMAEKIKMINDRVAQSERGQTGLLKTDLQNSIAKLEEVWEGEVGTLKHELWQTIQAHNHNADLLKHHKDAIDQVQSRMTEAVPNPELEQVHAQLMQVDKVMQRELAKEQQMDQLMQRLTVVQQQMSAGIGHWAGASPFLAAQAAAASTALAGSVAGNVTASTASAKKAQRKAAPKAGKSTKPSAASLAAAASLRAEAPEFVPTSGWPEV